jgi:hypothetical protein
MNHDESLWDILTHPHKIGLDNVVWSCRNIIVSPNGIVGGEIDLLFYLKDDIYVVGEYKRTRRNYDKALHQLEFASQFIAEYYMSECEKIFICRKKGGYAVEKIK